jgi:hypothetical protein
MYRSSGVSVVQRENDVGLAEPLQRPLDDGALSTLAFIFVAPDLVDAAFEEQLVGFQLGLDLVANRREFGAAREEPAVDSRGEHDRDVTRHMVSIPPRAGLAFVPKKRGESPDWRGGGWSAMSHLAELLADRPKRRLLALDGGGIRGAISLEILAAIESAIRLREGKPQLVLADWFDYVGGTSTGAIIAALISLGKPVAEIRDFYHKQGALMFDRAKLIERFWHTYSSGQLAAMLKSVIGPDVDLGSDAIRTLLLLVMRNATTDSHWPLSNNPAATYNARGPKSNLLFPLWQLVRASTAAPTYFPPEEIAIEDDALPFVFVDGGVTMYNNPAFLLFTMATLPAYRLQWPTGTDRMLLVSVGTGSSADANKLLAPDAMNLIYNVKKIPAALMYAALVQQDTLCRVFGACRHGDVLDGEIGDLCGDSGPAGVPKLFTYARYEPGLSRAFLDGLDLHDLPLANVQQMDSVAYIDDLALLGKRYAERHFSPEHLEGFYRT